MASKQPGLGMDHLQDTVPLDRGGRCPALCKLVPVGFKAEAWKLFVLSGPLVRKGSEAGGQWLSRHDLGSARGCSQPFPRNFPCWPC